jgi:hypothetical protein
VSDRSHLILVGGGKLDAVERRHLLERAHPEVTFVPPATVNDHWRAIVPLGKIPGHPDETTIGSYELAGLMDQLEEIWPPRAPGRQHRLARRTTAGKPLR